jgi:hypothetical protein
MIAAVHVETGTISLARVVTDTTTVVVTAVMIEVAAVTMTGKSMCVLTVA